MPRWRTLGELSTLSEAAAATAARALAASSAETDRVLGLESLDVLLVHHGERRYSDLLPLLDRACAPDQPADVVGAALGPYSMIAPASAAVRARQLVDHNDPTVRQRAVEILAAGAAPMGGDEDLPLTDREADAALVLAALDDPDERVAVAAADGANLLFWLDADASQDAIHQDVVAALRVRADSPQRAVRAAVLLCLVGMGERHSDDLVRALTDPDADHRLVERVPDIVRLVDAGRIAQALDRLAHNGWAARGSHDDYPTPVERRQMLEKARAAVARAR